VAVKPQPAPGPAPEPTPKPAPSPRPKGRASSLDRLIDDATGKIAAKPAVTPRPRPRPAPASDQPRTLTKAQIAAGMRLAAGGVSDCKENFKGTGLTVMVQVTIDGKTGRVSSGQALGRHRGTAGGECIVASVRYAARFPKFSGPPLKLKYPFIIR
jgi:hypothetical protein